MADVVPIRRPLAYTSNEVLIEELRLRVLGSGQTYKVIAAKVGVSDTTIRNLCIGNTRWPRPTTLFPLLKVLGLGLQITEI